MRFANCSHPQVIRQGVADDRKTTLDRVDPFGSRCQPDQLRPEVDGGPFELTGLYFDDPARLCNHQLNRVSTGPEVPDLGVEWQTRLWMVTAAFGALPVADERFADVAELDRLDVAEGLDRRIVAGALASPLAE